MKRLIFVFILFSQVTLAKEKMQKLVFDSGAELQVEIADTAATREKGLMGRTELAANHGMLFVFDFPHRLNFWTKDTFIPLSIAFFDENKVLKEIADLKAQSLMEKHQALSFHTSECQCLYALEVNQGWFKKNKVKVGDRFKLEKGPEPTP